MAITLSGDGIARANLAADVIDSTKLADDAVNSEHLADGSIDAVHLSANSVDSDAYVDASIDNAHLADDAVGVAELSATGTASSSTFLRGDNSWAAAGSPSITDNGNANAITIDSSERVVISTESRPQLQLHNATGDNGSTAREAKLQFGGKKNDNSEVIQGELLMHHSGTGDDDLTQSYFKQKSRRAGAAPVEYLGAARGRGRGRERA